MEQNQAPVETLDTGTYEIIRKRLMTQKDELVARLNQLNTARKEVFSSEEFALLANQRISTENNCIARGLISLGELCIFGYNVHFGLRSDIKISDVFSIYHFTDNKFEPHNLDLINDQDFINDYNNLYKYYRDAIFSKFRRTENYLYMVFQMSKNGDEKAFKWLIKDNKLIYQNDRSIHEVTKPNQFEFNWIKTTLENRRLGVHPHISILDKVFIEAIGGDITFKIEDNTNVGNGIYSEPVENKDQQLDDADYYYADLGNIILIRIKPYQEASRTFVYNTRTQQVQKIPMLNDSGILLPDNQGIIFANGYYLQNGDYKLFETELTNLEFFRKIVSPNGEDYLYMFYHQQQNTYVLMSYNIIKQSVETPIYCAGFTIFPNGNLIVFRAESEANRHHQVQIWNTPYSLELKENKEKQDDVLYRIGNKDIVKAMAECQEVILLINKEDSYDRLYEDIVSKSKDITDSYFWVTDKEASNLAEPLKNIAEIANSAIDEFQKVQEQKKFAQETLKNAFVEIDKLQFDYKNTKFDSLDKLVKLLAETRKMQGKIIELRNIKYIDLAKIDETKTLLEGIAEKLSANTVEFLLKDEALIPYQKMVEVQRANVETVTKVVDAQVIEENSKLISSELELLIDILNSLKIDDTTQVTQIIEKISLIFASLNELRAQLKKKVDSLKSKEAVAEFKAQLTLLEQSIVNYLELAVNPEKCDEYFTKISVQVEELESKFADFEEFVVVIADKRNEIIKAFEARKNQLVEQINRKTSSLEQIGLRVLKNVENKAQSFKTKEEIQSFYSADLMVDKVRKLADDLRNLGDVSKAENLENSLKTSLEDALRILKDKTELFADGENIISLGTHKFIINKQSLDLTIVRRNDLLYYHLTGTNFYYPMPQDQILQYQSIWEQDIVSENKQVYRSEYLAYLTLKESWKQNEKFDAKVFINNRLENFYSESYMKGVHDHDALLMFDALKKIQNELGVLSYHPYVRVAAQLYWYTLPEEERATLHKLIMSANSVLKAFPTTNNYQYVLVKLSDDYTEWSSKFGAITESIASKDVAAYLFEEYAEKSNFTISKQAKDLRTEFKKFIEEKGILDSYKADINDDSLILLDRFYLVLNWLKSFIELDEKWSKYIKYIPEAACILLLQDQNFELRESPDYIVVNDIRGSHEVITGNVYEIDYHNFIAKLSYFADVNVVKFNEFANLKNELVTAYKKSLKLDELKPKVLTSFVRNKLINEVYFPLIGSNFAKQLGAAGDNKRTARMGMLLLISPPGYGKTTLMEYVSKTMGLNFVKINGPTIGHSITSIDPAEAKTSGAREELKKINLAFEMADNVMLYIDDIQHCNPEFLQKFISLADGQRKMDGIFEGESKTYDLRGKRFCIVMAGNPYTESGDKFQIPDMLANRADVYNLGDVIGNTANLFKLSLLENSVAESPYMQKISNKSFTDFYQLVDFVESNSDNRPSLEGNYTQDEVNDCIAVLRNSIRIRNVVLKVNENYITSAAMQDSYRVEPPFKLQGSYRNMNKLVSQIVPLMNPQEINELLLTHYENESQTLTSDAEANLLKFKELAGMLNDTDQERWDHIKDVFVKNNKFGGINKDDQIGQILSQLSEFNDNLNGIKDALKKR